MLTLLDSDMPLLILILQWALIVNYLIITIYSFIYFIRLTHSSPVYWSILRSTAIVPIAIFERILNQLSLPSLVYLSTLLILFTVSSYLTVPVITNLKAMEKVINETLANAVKLKQFNKLAFEGLLLISFNKEEDEFCNLIDCNNVVLELTQFAKADIINTPNILFDSEDIKKLKQAIKARSVTPVFVDLKTNEGKRIPTEVHFHYFNVEKVNYLVLSIIDITDRVNLNNLFSAFTDMVEDQFLDLEQLNTKINSKIKPDSKDLLPNLEDDLDLLESYLDQSYLPEALDYIVNK